MGILAPSPRRAGTKSARPCVVHAPATSSPNGLADLLRERGPELERTLREEGAILFRGYGITAPEQLSGLVEASGERSMDYLAGDSPRTSLGGGAYTSTEAPPGIRIPLHNELSYLARFPRHLWMACAEPAREGGETTIGDGRAILRALDPEIRERFLVHGVRYRCAFRGPHGLMAAMDKAFHASKSWMAAFATDDAVEAEARCRRVAPRTEWTPDGSLAFETERPAILEHPETGDVAWFSQAHLFLLSPRYLGWARFAAATALFHDRTSRPHHATYGDGRPIEPETLEHLHDVLEANTIAVRWERGDALWIDNVVSMHGREPFSGSRRVMVALAA